jgi:uncharacterized membrane protein YgcG
MLRNILAAAAIGAAAVVSLDQPVLAQGYSQYYGGGYDPYYDPQMAIERFNQMMRNRYQYNQYPIPDYPYPTYNYPYGSQPNPYDGSGYLRDYDGGYNYDYGQDGSSSEGGYNSDYGRGGSSSGGGYNYGTGGSGGSGGMRFNGLN